MSGIVSDCLGLSGIVSDCLGLFGIVWDCLGLFGIVWDSGIVWDCLGLSGIIWDCLGLLRIVSSCLGLSAPDVSPQDLGSGWNFRAPERADSRCLDHWPVRVAPFSVLTRRLPIGSRLWLVFPSPREGRQ